ncbi:MAG: hypothetical protein LBG48_00700, partial [Rickettsiales bacterium]|nr:hypothetical protein [Rickettsiales bacterium]
MFETHKLSEYKTAEVCKHCGCKHLVKNGLDSRTSDQRYKCKNCKRTFILGIDKRIKHSIFLRKLTLSLYLSGTSIRGIQRVLNTCYDTKLYIRTILCWIKNANNLLEQENQ